MNKKWPLLTNLLSGLWFLPAIIVTGFIALAALLTTIDSHIDPQIRQRWPGLMTADVDSAREMLSSISASIVTVAGVVFSITIVTVTLASTQYSSRIVRTFTRDKLSQVILGGMAGTFAYCTAVLLTISGGEGAFVPSLAVFAGYVLATVGVFGLISFMHHVTTLIQASSIVAAIAADSIAAVEQTFTSTIPEPHRPDERARNLHWTTIPGRRTGYIEAVDIDALRDFAERYGAVVRMDRSAGDFVIEGKPLISVSLDGEPTEEQVAALNRAHYVGRFRTVDQDPDFGVRQIVDIALKALSPAVNDTTTGVLCVDHLTSILVSAAGRWEETEIRDNGRIRVFVCGPTFHALLAKSYDQIRQNASGNVAVITALLNALETLAGSVSDPSRREAIARQLRAIAELVRRSIPSPYDREELQQHVDKVSARLSIDVRPPAV